MKKSLLYLIMAIFLLSFVVGCSDSDDDDTDSTSTSTTKGLTGVVIADAYLSGAKVCVDKDKDKVCDADEASATTDASGKYTIDGDTTELSKYPILVEVPAGTAKVADRVTTATTTASYILMAPAGKPAVISPISTLIQASFEKGDGTISDCEKSIANKTGLTEAVVYNNFVALTDKVSQKMLCVSTLMAETFATEVVSLDAKAVAGDVIDTTKTYTKNSLLLYNLMFAKIIEEELQSAVDTINTFYSDNGNTYTNFKTKSVKAVTCSSVTKYNILNILSLYDYSDKTTTESDTLKKILDSGTTNGEVYLNLSYNRAEANTGNRLAAYLFQFTKDTTTTTKGSVAFYKKRYSLFGQEKKDEVSATYWDGATGGDDKYYYLLNVAGDNGSIWSAEVNFTDSFAGDYVYDESTDTVTVVRSKGDTSSYKFSLKKLTDLTASLISSYYDKTKIPFVSEIYPYVDLTAAEKATFSLATATDTNATYSKFLSASSVAYQPSLIEVSDRYFVDAGSTVDSESSKNATIDTFVAKKNGDCLSFAYGAAPTQVVKLLDDNVTDTYGTGSVAYPLYASFAQASGGVSNVINFWEYNTTTEKYSKVTTQGSWVKETVRGVQMLICTIPTTISSKYDSFAKDYQIIFVEYDEAKAKTGDYTTIRKGRYTKAGLKYDKTSGLVGSYVFNQDAFKTVNKNIAKFEKLAWKNAPYLSGQKITYLSTNTTIWNSSGTGLGIIDGTAGGVAADTTIAVTTAGIATASYASILNTGANTIDTESGVTKVYLKNADNLNLLRAKDYDCSIISGTADVAGTTTYTAYSATQTIEDLTTKASVFFGCKAVLLDKDANTFYDSIGFILTPKTVDTAGVPTGHSKFTNLNNTITFGDIVFRVTDKKALNEYIDGTISKVIMAP